MKTTNKQRIALVATAAAFSLAVPMTALAGFFPADRPTYTCATPTSCKGADHVVFNSFTNNPVVGDERPFLAGSIGGANVQDLVNVKDGDIVNIRAFVHNNADPSLIGVEAAKAKNVKIHVNVPTVSKKDQTLVAFLSASNASPGTINDTMNLHGDRPFTVSYVPDSAQFTRKADGTNLTTTNISNNIVGSNGTFLGDIHGCFEYSGYVTLKVKVSMPTPVTPPTPVPPKTTPPVTPPATPVTPAAPTALPETGPEAALAGMAGTGALGYAVVAYRRSKKALADKLLNRE